MLGALVSSTGAFSSVQAPRATDVDTAGDDNALLGISLAPYIDAGQSGEDLVTVTNNSNVPLTVTVTLANASGTVSPTNPTIQPSDSQLFSVDLSSEASAGDNALTIDISATDGSSLNIDLSRSLGVRNFLRRLQDKTENTNALFYLSYRLQNMDNFQSYELIVENLGPARDDLPTRTYTSTDVEHIFRIPTSGTDGGAVGDTYRFTMRIYDTDGLAIERVLEDVADGVNPADNDDIGGAPDDPIVVDFTVTDTTENDNTHFSVDYEVDNLDNLKEVQVTFDNQANNWSDSTVTTTDAPTGTVTYDEGGTEGDTYDITVETINTNDISTDSLTKTEVADGDDIGSTPTPTPSPGAEVVDFTITDTTKNNNGKFKVDYEITSDPTHDYVEVVFDNQSNNWADQTKTSNQSPTGSVNYTQGGVQGDTYDITVRAINDSGNVTDFLTKTDVADGTDP